MAVDRDLIEVYLKEAEPLTDWENEPKVSDLKHDYDEARSHHDAQAGKISQWLDNLNVTGSARIEKKKGRSTIVPKLIRKQAEWRYAALSEPFLSTPDLFKASPSTWQDKKAAIQTGLILNHQFNHQLNKVKFIDDFVRAAVDEGTVIVRTGWDFQEEEQDVEVPIMETRPVTDPVQVQAMLAQGIPPVEEVPVGIRIERQMVTTVNKPTIEVCNYNNVIIDPTCRGDMEKCNFVIFRFQTDMSELEKTGLYRNLDVINVEDHSILNEPDAAFTEDQSFNFKDKPRKKFVAYEYWGYWDIEGNGTVKPIVATWVGDTMIRMEENPFPDGKVPFVVVQYLPKRHSVYGEPDGELLEDNQKIIGAVTRGMIDIMGRSAAGQKGIRMDALDVTNKRKFDRGDDYEFNAHIDPRQAIHDHVYPEIPNSAQFMLQLQNMEAESLTGVKAFHGGVNGDTLGQTATGIRGALDAASKRELGILRRLASGIVEVGKKIMAMNQVFLSDEEVVRRTDEEFVPVQRDELAGNVDIELHISTAEADNAQAQELAFMLQTMGNSMPFEMSQMILADIARLRKMPELSKRIEEYRPQPDPIQQQMQQLEMQRMQMEIKKMESEIMENQAEAMLDQAKAREAEGKADMMDLDFVEQESGVKQERDLQKQGAQAEANMKLKMLENALKGGTDLEKERIKARAQLLKNQNQPPTSE
jgi:hypothetical protein